MAETVCAYALVLSVGVRQHRRRPMVHTQSCSKIVPPPSALCLLQWWVATYPVSATTWDWIRSTSPDPVVARGERCVPHWHSGLHQVHRASGDGEHNSI